MQMPLYNTGESPRKSFLIRADGHAPGVCEACEAPIVFVWTKRGAQMPMDKGFEIAEFVPINLEGPRGPVSVTLLRVYSGESHFATCAARKVKTAAASAA